MRNLISALEPFDRKKKCINVVVETPKGSRVKYAYDEETRLFEVKKALPEGMVFPFNFGFIPSTVGDDGDPLDILILNEEPLVPGCLLRARLIGAIEATQKEKGETMRNDRLIGMAIMKESPTFMEDLKVSKKTWSEIEHFFIFYNQLSGKKFKVMGRGGEGVALKLVKAAMKEFEKK